MGEYLDYPEIVTVEDQSLVVLDCKSSGFRSDVVTD